MGYWDTVIFLVRSGAFVQCYIILNNFFFLLEAYKYDSTGGHLCHLVYHVLNYFSFCGLGL